MAFASCAVDRELPCTVSELVTTDQGYVRCFWILRVNRRLGRPSRIPGTDVESSDVQALAATAEVSACPVAARDSLPTRSLCRCAAAQKHALSAAYNYKGVDVHC